MSEPWQYPCHLEDGRTVNLESGREYYWKRSDGWQWDGRERWWEYYAEIYPGMDGTGGVYITEKSRWNGAAKWHFQTPRHLSLQETHEMFLDIVKHLDAANTQQHSEGRSDG